MLEIERIPFGMSNVLIGASGAADSVNFNGVEEFQAEGGEVVITPLFEDVNIADFGTAVYDKVVVGYTVSVTLVAAQESLKVMQLALSATNTITDAATAAVTGLTDSPIGTSMRSKGKPVQIHPRNLAATNKERDINIYKMISDGDFTRATSNSQGSITITLNSLPRDGIDPSKPGNFFYMGGTDPNAAAPATTA